MIRKTVCCANGYDGLENPLCRLKAKQFPQRPYTGFQFLKDKEIHTKKVMWCGMSSFFDDWAREKAPGDPVASQAAFRMLFGKVEARAEASASLSLYSTHLGNIHSRVTHTTYKGGWGSAADSRRDVGLIRFWKLLPGRFSYSLSHQ